nr:response regulator [Deinobacterium chartae]
MLVEDNPADALLTEEAFSQAEVPAQLWVVGDGVEALAFLRHEGEYEQVPRPDLILLDLNMPRMNGLELLEEVKSDPLLGDIPVVMLTTSTNREDVRRAYALHASAYVPKPMHLEAFLDMVRSFSGFWLHLAVLPVATELS